MKAYKAFNSDLTCRDFQFEIGKTYTHKGRIELCGSGFHACVELQQIFQYYTLSKNVRVCEVEIIGNWQGDTTDKIVTDKLKIVREIDIYSEELWSKLTDDEYRYRYCKYVSDRKELWSTIQDDECEYLYCRHVNDRKELRSIRRTGLN